MMAIRAYGPRLIELNKKNVIVRDTLRHAIVTPFLHLIRLKIIRQTNAKMHVFLSLLRYLSFFLR